MYVVSQSLIFSCIYNYLIFKYNITVMDSSVHTYMCTCILQIYQASMGQEFITGFCINKVTLYREIFTIMLIISIVLYIYLYCRCGLFLLSLFFDRLLILQKLIIRKN